MGNVEMEPVKPETNGVAGKKEPTNDVTPVRNGTSKTGSSSKNENDVKVSNGQAKDPENPDLPVFQNDFPSNEESFDSSLPTPPDGGWGWWVVFASFMIHVIGKFVNDVSNHNKRLICDSIRQMCLSVCFVSVCLQPN